MSTLHRWTPEQVRRFWDYESQFPANYWSRCNGKKLIDIFANDIKKSKNILDFGCGDGGLLEHLIPYIQKNSIGKVYGFDISKDSVEKVNKKFKKQKSFVSAFQNIESLEKTLKGDTFDFIFCCETIEHVYDSDLFNILDTVKRVLSNNGYLLLTTPNNENLSENFICNPIDGSLFHRWQHVRSWNKDSVTQSLKENQFKVVDLLETSVLWHCSFPKNIYRRIRYKDKVNLFIKCQKE